jgi:hypothetical protein
MTTSVTPKLLWLRRGRRQARLDLAQINARIIRQIVDQVAPQSPNAIYVVATNPCDVLAHVVWAHFALPRERVISTGTTLDTARLRTLSERLDVVAPAIHAYVLGEHGASAMIHWSGATVAGMPLDAFLSRTGRELSPASRDFILRSVHDAAQMIKEGKGARRITALPAQSHGYVRPSCMTATSFFRSRSSSLRLREFRTSACRFRSLSISAAQQCSPIRFLTTRRATAFAKVRLPSSG